MTVLPSLHHVVAPSREWRACAGRVWPDSQFFINNASSFEICFSCLLYPIVGYSFELVSVHGSCFNRKSLWAHDDFYGLWWRKKLLADFANGVVTGAFVEQRIAILCNTRSKLLISNT
jgi:hypothetical protein